MKRNETRVRPWLWNLFIASVCAAIGTWLIARYGDDGALYYLPTAMLLTELQR